MADDRVALRVSPAEAATVLAELADRDTPCTASEAATFAGQLLGFYPAREVHDARTYVSGMTAVMAAYPRDLVKRICHPVTGLPARLKWLPTIADVNEALTAELDRRKRIAANARTVLDQDAKRRAEAEEARAFSQLRPPPEERARRVQELLRGATKGISDVPKNDQP
ncbi:MAG: hypothetical protein ABFD96_06130 [Armatimonadia bacterium]